MDLNKKVLTRSKHGIVSGTLSGLAVYYNINLNRLRLVFIVSAFFGVGFAVYFVLWISVPSYAQRSTIINALIARQEEHKD